MPQTQGRRRGLRQTLKKKLTNTRKMKNSEGYDMFSKPCSNIN